MRFLPNEAANGVAALPDPAGGPFESPPLRPPIRVETGEFQRLEEILTLYHAKRALRRVAEHNAFPGFALLLVKTGGNSVGLEMVTSSWPSDPCDALRAPGGPAAELRARLAEETLPFHLTEAQTALVGTPAAATLCLPVYNDLGRGALLFAAESEARDGAHAELHLYAIYVFARICALTRPRPPTTALAPREIDCLRWSAAGKTSGEIAAILGVSENTVNSYLAAAAQKLNAVNRVQTVAQAIRLGLLG